MLSDFVHAFVTLFVTADPISVVPIFIILAGNLTAAQRHQIALRAALTAGIILVAFTLLGDSLIRFFGITIEAFEVAGGLLLFIIGFRMVFGQSDPDPRSGTQPDGQQNLTQIAIFPLAIPMIAGPGAISATILLSGHEDAGLLGRAELLGAVIALMVLTYAVLLLSGRIDRFLGETGRIVVSRLLGVILSALALQFIGNGITTFAEQIARHVS